MHIEWPEPVVVGGTGFARVGGNSVSVRLGDGLEFAPGSWERVQSIAVGAGAMVFEGHLGGVRVVTPFEGLTLLRWVGV